MAAIPDSMDVPHFCHGRPFCWTAEGRIPLGSESLHLGHHGLCFYCFVISRRYFPATVRWKSSQTFRGKNGIKNIFLDTKFFFGSPHISFLLLEFPCTDWKLLLELISAPISRSPHSSLLGQGRQVVGLKALRSQLLLSHPTLLQQKCCLRHSDVTCWSLNSFILPPYYKVCKRILRLQFINIHQNCKLVPPTDSVVPPLGSLFHRIGSTRVKTAHTPGSSLQNHV